MWPRRQPRHRSYEPDRADPGVVAFGDVVAQGRCCLSRWRPNSTTGTPVDPSSSSASSSPQWPWCVQRATRGASLWSRDAGGLSPDRDDPPVNMTEVEMDGQRDPYQRRAAECFRRGRERAARAVEGDHRAETRLRVSAVSADYGLPRQLRRPLQVVFESYACSASALKPFQRRRPRARRAAWPTDYRPPPAWSTLWYPSLRYGADFR